MIIIQANEWVNPDTHLITQPYCIDCGNDVQSYMHVVLHDVDGATWCKTVCDVCLGLCMSSGNVYQGTTSKLANGWIVWDTVKVND